MKDPKFTIKHVGINTPDEAAARLLTGLLCSSFALEPNNETKTHIFAGSLFEVMKNESIGTHGHIAMQTEDVEAAISFFAERGIGIQNDTIRRNADGKIIFAYLDAEFGGFAVHLAE